MGGRMEQVPREVFVDIWSAAESLDEVVDKVVELAGGPVPRWAVMARVIALRQAGVEMRRLPSKDGRGA